MTEVENQRAEKNEAKKNLRKKRAKTRLSFSITTPLIAHWSLFRRDSRQGAAYSFGPPIDWAAG